MMSDPSNAPNGHRMRLYEAGAPPPVMENRQNLAGHPAIVPTPVSFTPGHPKPTMARITDPREHPPALQLIDSAPQRAPEPARNTENFTEGG